MNKIGIIGGMGPEATINLYGKIINIFQKKYGAKYDSDYPEIYLVNLPIPDIVENVKNLSKVNAMMEEACKKLYSLGTDFIAIPCNTINLLYEQYGASIAGKVSNIVDETGQYLSKKRINKIGLLATKTTYNFQLYQKYFKKYNIQIMIPSDIEIEEINKIILRLLNGKKSARDKDYLLNISKKFIQNGAKGIVLGCTDLPLIFNQSDANFPIIDTIEVLAEKCVYFTRRKLSSGGSEQFALNK